jgi:hypothetical protein
MLDHVIQSDDVKGVRFIRRIREGTIENVVAPGGDGGRCGGNLHAIHSPAHGRRRFKKGPETAPYVEQSTHALVG